jgi:hypothetical protein
MSKRKPVTITPKREPYDLAAHNVCAPDACNISPNNRSGASLVEWWRVAGVYVEAMNTLDRVVMFAPDGDGGYWLASHPKEIPDAR